MAEDAPDALDRIDRAIARIEAAAAARHKEHAALAGRHDALRRRIGEAIGALDDVIARGDTA